MIQEKPNWGKKLGLLTPATNLTVEDELWRMRVEEVTIATARIVIDQVEWKTEQDLERFVLGVAERLPETTTRVMQAQPNGLLLGISSSNLWGGIKTNTEMKARARRDTGLELTTPVDAMIEGLDVFKARRIGVVTPYPELADAQVVSFFKEIGVEVVAQKGLRCKSARDIAEVPPAVLRDALCQVRVKGVEALVTLGTDLKISRVAAEAERWLGLPVLAVNATTWWCALRQQGVTARLLGWGTLLEDH
ncbi:hypothetical protein BHS06_04145 [Myxococcus xanthus]|uniref:maleate cis-trans isomerase family protein n=1 Tax=Myxococcus xanthus TaxID=34 RepID=UPI0011267128|nr:arylmalonate decarboxylase [Myxococcus xanthus]QDE88206.1 hypothetical protein BHS06_04145 [Myxococcus xanthus]